jgi:hypothetical protein
VTLLGILMLDTRFPRVAGDVGHPDAFGVPMRPAVVRGASPLRVVRDRDPALLQPFVDAARALVAQGATAITTSCGFLVLFQRELQAAVPVPVWTSSLLKLPELHRPGVVTVDAASLGRAHLLAARADPDTPVEGLAPGCAFQRTLLENRVELDVRGAEHETVAAARRLVARCPDIDSLVLECTNMPPYADAVAQATGRPVHHLPSLVRERLKGLA